MESSLNHLQLNVGPDNLPFYRDFFAFLGWRKHEFEMENMYYGFVAPDGASIWVLAQANGHANDYDGPGVNHVGIACKTQSGVDEAIAYLGERGIDGLFETPRHRPHPNGTDTYYQVMFTTPDNILFEVMYSGPRS